MADGHGAARTAEAAHVRTSDLPWTEMRIGGAKLLRRSPETGWMHHLLRGDPGQVNAPHTHQGPAMFYVIEGGFDFRGGSAQVGDWVWEPAGAVHEATSHTAHTVYIGTLFGAVGMHDEGGRPPGYGDPIGAALVRTGDLPWLNDGRGGQVRILRASPETGWIHLLLKGQAGEARAPHLCLGACEMYVVEGEIDYAGGRAKAGDWVWLPAGTREEALRFAADGLVLVNYYGPVLYGADDLMDWRSVQRLAEIA